MFAATVHARALALLALIGLLALGAALWATTAQGAEHLDGPALEEGYGAELSGDNEVPAVDSAASGSFLIDLDPGEVDFDEPRRELVHLARQRPGDHPGPHPLGCRG